MSKTFWGYNSREEAEEHWPKKILDGGIKTQKVKQIKSTDNGREYSNELIIETIEIGDTKISYEVNTNKDTK